MSPRLLPLLLASAACHRSPAPPEVRIDCRVLPEVLVVGPATLDITLSDARHQPLRAASVRVEGSMSHPGMVPSIAQATAVGPGRYRATVPLTMAGDWFFVVSATLADGQRVERTVDAPHVRPR